MKLDAIVRRCGSTLSKDGIKCSVPLTGPQIPPFNPEFSAMHLLCDYWQALVCIHQLMDPSHARLATAAFAAELFLFS